jgi:two-component system LytT family response regulator
MPVLNGFQMLEKIGKIDFHIIFTTAYDEFAIRAFKVGAVDYLLKPIDSNELEEAVARVRKRMLEPNSMSHIETLLRNMQKKDKIDGRLTVPTLNGLEVLPIDEIIRCEADSNYTTLFLPERKVVISKTLKDIEEQLKDYPFVRVHQSHLIHLAHVQKYIKGNGGQVVMDNGDYLNVSRNRKQLLLDALAGK